VPSCPRDAAAETEVAFGIVQQRVAGRFHPEAMRLDALAVSQNLDARDGPGVPPKLALDPFVGTAFRLHEDDNGSHAITAMNQHTFQLGQTGPRAGAVRMGEQDQREPSGRVLDLARRGPLRRGHTSAAGGSREAEKNPLSDEKGDQPQAACSREKPCPPEPGRRLNPRHG
jgi:hypothetical protein